MKVSILVYLYRWTENQIFLKILFFSNTDIQRFHQNGGLKIENLLSQFSLSQVINQPTYMSQNFNSCIYIFQINKI